MIEINILKTKILIILNDLRIMLLILPNFQTSSASVSASSSASEDVSEVRSMTRVTFLGDSGLSVGEGKTLSRSRNLNSGSFSFQFRVPNPPLRTFPRWSQWPSGSHFQRILVDSVEFNSLTASTVDRGQLSNS